MDDLRKFCAAFGLKMNIKKSRGMCSRIATRRRRDNFTSISAIRFTSSLGKYLGFPLIQGRVSKSIFAKLMDKINNHLASWKRKLLNRAGRVCLANSVLASILVHLMQTLWFPKQICLSLDFCIRHFIWGGKEGHRSFSMIGWNVLTTPKRFGGLGIHDAWLTNISLLGKLVENLVFSANKPWVHILSHKYLQCGSIFGNFNSNGTSYVGCNILKALKEIHEGGALKFMMVPLYFGI